MGVKKIPYDLYRYTGPEAPALVLPNGYKVLNPANLNGQALHDLLERQPQLQTYYQLVDDGEEE